MSGGAGRLAGVAFNSYPARHHVLRNSNANVSVHGHLRLLVHPSAVKSDMPVNFDIQWRLKTAGNRMLAHWIIDYPMAIRTIDR
jgi:hypothetical protein